MKSLRIAITCPSATGHLNPSLALAAELKLLGHDVRLAGFLDSEAKARAAGIQFHPVAEREYPRGRMGELWRELGNLSGFAASRFTVRLVGDANLAQFRDLPRVWEREGIEALVLDQISTGAASAAQASGLPYASIANALWLSRDISSPPWVASWSHRPGFFSRARNWSAHAPLRLLLASSQQNLNRCRRARGLGPLGYQDWGESRLAVVAQQPEGFEFPGVRVPEHVHFTGPFHRAETREQVPFPFERLDGRPLIYTSMGTIQNQLLPVFRAIAGACAGLEVQLVIALGVEEAKLSEELAGRPITVSFAPQLELLRRASLVITHAGLNTALESLAHGVPMVAIPIANDQPGVAARLARLGAAEVVPLKWMNEQRVRAAVQKVLCSQSHRQAARKIQNEIAEARGLEKAAEVIVQALTTRQPVKGRRAAPGG